VRELLPAAPLKPAAPAERAAKPRRRRITRWLRKLIFLPFALGASALLLAGFMPALFVALVLLLPALAPLFVVLASMLMSTSPREVQV
jgi:hypothetical protein